MCGFLKGKSTERERERRERERGREREREGETQLHWICKASREKNQTIAKAAGLRIEFASGDGDEAK